MLRWLNVPSNLIDRALVMLPAFRLSKSAKPQNWRTRHTLPLSVKLHEGNTL